MKNFKLTLALCAFTSFSALAAEKAGGVFVEPMLTYESGTSEVSFPSPAGNSESDFDAVGIGARFGFHIHEAIFLGVDGRYSQVDYENDDTNIKTDGESYNLGPVVGFQMPTTLGLRVWASYIMAGELDLDEDQGIDATFEDASGYRVGAGIKLSMVSLNLEYQHIEYDKTTLKDAGFFSGSTSNVDADNKSYILSVSFPISL